METAETFDLVRRAKDGQAAALDTLLTRYYPRVMKIVRLRMGASLRDNMQSADVLQDTFTRAVKSFDQFELQTEASVINWLAGIAENTIRDAADYHSAKKRHAARRVALETDAGSEMAARATSPASAAGQAEEQAILEECIAELPDGYREIIILRDYAGYSWEEVAEHHGRPSAAAARMLYGNALLELRRLLRAAGVAFRTPGS